MITAEKIAQIPEINANTSPVDIYQRGRELVAGRFTLASSFSIEDIVLIDLLKAHLHDITIFAIDTGRLNEETYEVAENLVQRYGLQIDWYFPRTEAIEQLEREKGLFSFRESIENRKECCHIRKVEPLLRALKGYVGWITGLRRAQSVTRSEQSPLEIDQANSAILKINPLTFWSNDRVWTYAEQHRLPINKLHKLGYPSIGCSPCTRAVQPGEDLRSGRWWWESAEHRECGLHRR